eukprot:3992027-Amphidinium_carterae.2
MVDHVWMESGNTYVDYGGVNPHIPWSPSFRKSLVDDLLVHHSGEAKSINISQSAVLLATGWRTPKSALIWMHPSCHLQLIYLNTARQSSHVAQVLRQEACRRSTDDPPHVVMSEIFDFKGSASMENT